VFVGYCEEASAVGRATNKSIAIIAFTDKHDEELATVLLEESGFRVVICASNEDLVEELDANGRRVAMIFADTDRGDAAALAVAQLDYPWIEVVAVSRRAAKSERRLGKPWQPLDLLIAAEAVRSGRNSSTDRR
jgi:hypothetical protein